MFPIISKISNCTDCYRCLRSCNVKAISFRAKQAKIMEAEAEKTAKILAAEAESEAIMKVQQATADALKLLNEAAPNDQVVKLKALEAMTKVADGKATKIIIPSELQGLAGLAASAKAVFESEEPKA